jgi:uncharacterized membrane protein
MKFLAAHSFQAGENEGNELDAFGLFKLTHFSKRKKGYMLNAIFHCKFVLLCMLFSVAYFKLF